MDAVLSWPVAVFVAVGVLLLVWALFVEPYAVGVDERDLVMKDLPPGLDGLRILVVGDLHCRGPGRRELWFGETARRLAPDLILSPGDLVEAGGEEALVSILATLHPPRGFVMVPGNNEHEEHDSALLLERLEEAGVRVLVNDAIRLGDDLAILGVDDPHLGRDDLEAALAACPPAPFRILLSHTPEVFPGARDAGLPLVVTGHTHGGQVRLPLVGALWVDTPRTGRRYARGWFAEGASVLLVTPGVGMSKLPLRFMCPPRIHLITLRGANPSPGDGPGGR